MQETQVNVEDDPAFDEGPNDIDEYMPDIGSSGSESVWNIP